MSRLGAVLVEQHLILLDTNHCNTIYVIFRYLTRPTSSVDDVALIYRIF